MLRSSSSMAVLAAPLLMLAALLLAPAPGLTQEAGTPPALTGDAVSAPAEDPALDQARIEDLIATLEDEQRRTDLIQNLRLLLQTEEEEAEPPHETVMEALGARVMPFLSERLVRIGAQAGMIANAFNDLPRVADWFQRQASDPNARVRWLNVFLNMGLVLVLGIVTHRLIRFALAGPRRALTQRPPASFLGKLLVLAGDFVLRLVPLAGFAIAAYVALALTDPVRQVRLVTIGIVGAAITIGAIMALTRLFLAPQAPQHRLFALSDETAAYLYRWVRRLVVTAVLGFFIVEAGLTLGLPYDVRGFLIDLVALVVAVLLVILVLQNRRRVAEVLRGRREGGGVLTIVRRSFAETWYVFALLYIAVFWGVFLLDISGGIGFMVRATVSTIVIILVSRLLIRGEEAAVRRGMGRADAAGGRPAGRRTGRYLPLVDRLAKGAVVIVAGLALLQAWGFGGFEWLATNIGRRATGSVLWILIVLAVAATIWEIVSNLIERHLTRTDETGNYIEQSARIRTLLPLLRNGLMVLMIVIVGLIVLSELGLNIAPLLAGAGVVGLAIGFGSQTLVKDVITGLFILFEDTIAIGDVVDLGGGHSGAVESMSIRTIRLRDLSGQIHVVPFSSVTTITNMTRDFSFYVFDVGVAYREDTDQVIEVLKQLGQELQDDPEFAPVILEPLEVIGVDAFKDSAVIIKARFKTRPSKQWMVGREFNRRMKKRFDELKIEIPLPHVRLYFGQDRQGKAPPARISLEGQSFAEEIEQDRGHPAASREGRSSMRLVTPGRRVEHAGDQEARSTLGHDDADEKT